VFTAVQIGSSTGLDRERGADGALGIVLVRDRRPKTAITASPMNASHRAAVPLDLFLSRA
jgi:hypothetical protein